MPIKEHTTPEKLEYYSFLWSIARMVIAAFSLFFGVSPILYKVLGSSTSNSLLGLSYLITGAATAYLLYIWFKSEKKVFGGFDMKDRVAFLIMIVTGLNLGLSVLINDNIGVALMENLPTGLAVFLFKAIAIGYLVVAYYLWKRWNASGKKVF